MKQFLEIYGQEYYGSRWHSAELDEKIRKLMLIKTGQSIAKNPRSAKHYLSFLRGQRLRFAITLKIADLLVRKFN